MKFCLKNKAYHPNTNMPANLMEEIEERGFISDGNQLFQITQVVQPQTGKKIIYKNGVNTDVSSDNNNSFFLSEKKGLINEHYNILHSNARRLNETPAINTMSRNLLQNNQSQNVYIGTATGSSGIRDGKTLINYQNSESYQYNPQNNISMSPFSRNILKDQSIRKQSETDFIRKTPQRGVSPSRRPIFEKSALEKSNMNIDQTLIDEYNPTDLVFRNLQGNKLMIEEQERVMGNLMKSSPSEPLFNNQYNDDQSRRGWNKQPNQQNSKMKNNSSTHNILMKTPEPQGKSQTRIAQKVNKINDRSVNHDKFNQDSKLNKSAFDTSYNKVNNLSKAGKLEQLERQKKISEPTYIKFDQNLEKFKKEKNLKRKNEKNEHDYGYLPSTDFIFKKNEITPTRDIFTEKHNPSKNINNNITPLRGAVKSMVNYHIEQSRIDNSGVSHGFPNYFNHGN